ncbi:MAG: anhydro-N-acetylmuramic acid kinase [Chitinophagaceae bacterium]|nr:anhydro-N-acetylmuramic acid kinase [Chitinophagaceae bacterium]
MIYHAIGTMSGSSMDGLDIAYCRLEETGGQWQYEIVHADCIPFHEEWKNALPNLTSLSAKDLMMAHTAFGRWMGEAILEFISTHQLQYKVHLIASHGHTVFHDPAKGLSFQLGDGATIAATTGLPVVSDLRNMDVALGGQGAPIVPIGEKLLWKDFDYFLNIGGISNISITHPHRLAFDVCPANRVLNLLAQKLGKPYDENGHEASIGTVHVRLLHELNALDYYRQAPPKSLANEFGSEVIMNILQGYEISVQDKLRTMVEHIVDQVERALPSGLQTTDTTNQQMMVTGGGALNTFLIQCLQSRLQARQIDLIVPDSTLIQYKEALIMALIGVLRWREESNVLQSVTGASRDSVGGALWMGE